MKRHFLILILTIFVGNVFAQEVLTDFGNIVLQKYSKEYFSKLSLKETLEFDTLDLPFFDDFAHSFVYPDSTKWMDKFAFVNNDYAIDPVSIGVGTLDAINQYGAVYSHLPSVSSAIAEYLTSMPINLNVDAADSVYLSFYYQAGGNGNTPELRDSRVLQFKSPETQWKSVWRQAGGVAMDTFKLVLIPITNEDWLVKGFQFRFLNYASVSSAYEPSWISNTDHWNLDYIKLDTARSYLDTLANDVAFIKSFASMLNGFESVPWNHYKLNHAGLVIDSLTWIYKNSWDDTYNINRQVEIVDLYGSNIGFSMLDDSENILPFETIEYTRKIPYFFSSDSQDSARFMLKGYIRTDLTEDRYIYRFNDTIQYYQKFENYYAYDDGTAEKGYGITGQNTAYSSLAYQFTPLVADTLYGVYIYFNQVMNEGNRKYFFLNVWADDNGVPGDTVFQKIGVIPEYSDEINGFIYYSLDTALYVDTTFYIGWTKTTDDMLNCGFDMNNVANQHLFYNVSGEWQNSSIAGALMVRPVFGYHPIRSASIESPIVVDFDIYPNPANEYIKISSLSANDMAEIYDATGKLIKRQNASGEINTSDLPSGMYIVRLVSNLGEYKTKKLLIAR
jgi:hypothetical protein